MASKRECARTKYMSMEDVHRGLIMEEGVGIIMHIDG